MSDKDVLTFTPLASPVVKPKARSSIPRSAHKRPVGAECWLLTPTLNRCHKLETLLLNEVSLKCLETLLNPKPYRPMIYGPEDLEALIHKTANPEALSPNGRLEALSQRRQASIFRKPLAISTISKGHPEPPKTPRNLSQILNPNSSQLQRQTPKAPKEVA